jgi:hypothetical protein
MNGISSEEVSRVYSTLMTFLLHRKSICSRNEVILISICAARRCNQFRRNSKVPTFQMIHCGRFAFISSHSSARTFLPTAHPDAKVVINHARLRLAKFVRCSLANKHRPQIKQKGVSSEHSVLLCQRHATLHAHGKPTPQRDSISVICIYRRIR